MTILRRSFLTGLGALLAAPAIVKADSLMRVRGIVMPERIPIPVYDGYDPIHDLSMWRVDCLYGVKKIYRVPLIPQ
jgi:hypothetical protein